MDKVKLKQQYDDWAAKPTPDSMSPMLQTLTPTIRSVMSSNGLRDDPNIELELKSVLADHIKDKYDPSKAALNTFAYDVLRRTPRIAAKQRHGVHVPESADFAKRKVYAAHESLFDRFNREPTANELADATGLSTKRIAEIDRRYSRPEVSQSFSETMSGQGGLMAGGDDPRMQMWIEATVGSMNANDQKIYEWLTRSHPLTKTQIAGKLGVSSAAITQRVSKIVNALNEINE